MKFEFTKGQIERLLETYNVKDIDKLLNENVVGSVIGRFFGKKLVSTLESRYGDDIIIILDRLFANAESRGSIITGVDKKLYLIAGNNKKWSMETIKNAINAVASGKLPPDTLDLLPKTLKDGSTFRETLQNQLSRVKPKTAPKSKPQLQPKPSSTNVGGATTILTEEQLWKYFADQMSKLNVVKKLGAQQGKLFIEEMAAAIEKEISKNGQKIELSLDKLKKQYDSIKSPSERAKLLSEIQDNILNLGKNKTTTSESQSNRLEAFMNFMKGPQDKKTLKYIFITSTITSLVLDTMRAYDSDQEFKGHFGMNIPKTVGVKAAAIFVGSVLLKMNMVGVILNVGIALESLLRSIPWFFGRNDKPKQTLKQKVQATGAKVKKTADSVYNANKPKIDSLKNAYKPKVDSVVQKLKTDYKDRSTNNEPLTGDNRPVIKY
jgi:hypothetical protein